MAQVTSPHIWYYATPSYPGPAVDLRRVEQWFSNPADPTVVKVRFTGGTDLVTLETSLAAFEAAKQNSLSNGG